MAYETKHTYHYIGSQITTIDIQGKEDETVVKNDQIRIHLGANSRPISFEYYTDIGTEQEASETYYYHYDLHGNVIRVTDDAGATEITYAYDALGTIVSETNTNSIYNPFTWSGEAQVIHDPEFNTTASSPVTGLYNSGSGYYNPETGTFLSGTGMPADVNPTSTRHEDVSAMLSRPMSQQSSSGSSATVSGCVRGGGESAESSNSVEPEDEAKGFSGGASSSDIIAGTGTSNTIQRTPDGFWWGDGPDPRKMQYWGASGLGGIGDNFIQPGPRKIGTGGGSRTLKTGLGLSAGIVGADAEIVNIGDKDTNLTTDEDDKDTDGDGTVDSQDDDIDNDGVVNWLDKDIDNDGVDDTWDDADPAKDTYAPDDNLQYTMVIRDKHGKIVAYQKEMWGNITLFPTDKDGNRTSNCPIDNSKDAEGYVESWKNICGSVCKGESSIHFFNSDHKETAGSIGMQIDDEGTWVGIFVDPNSIDKVSVKQGKAIDFGLDLRYAKDWPNGAKGLMAIWIFDENIWRGLACQWTANGIIVQPLQGGYKGPYGGGKYIPARWNIDHWDLRDLADYP